MTSYGAVHEGCSFSVVDCDWGNSCMPRESCPGGRAVFRHRWHQGGHHHRLAGDIEITVELIPPGDRWTLLEDDPE
jgi:hypothetical protein